MTNLDESNPVTPIEDNLSNRPERHFVGLGFAMGILLTETLGNANWLLFTGSLLGRTNSQAHHYYFYAQLGIGGVFLVGLTGLIAGILLMKSNKFIRAKWCVLLISLGYQSLGSLVLGGTWARMDFGVA